MQKVELRYWWEQDNEKDKNELVEWKEFTDSDEIKSADLKEKLLFKSFPVCRTTWI